MLIKLWEKPTAPESSVCPDVSASSCAATSLCLRAMIFVDSNISLPGPSDQQYVGALVPSSILHVELLRTQGLPSSGPPWQSGPAVLGETSPRLVDAKAATNCSAPVSAPGSAACSMYCDAVPLWSAEMRWLVKFIDVGCAANQLKSPSGLRSAPWKLSCTSAWSVLAG